VHISGTATDDEAVRDVYISVYNPSRNLFGSQEKVFYQAADRPEDRSLEFAADIPLTPGNNIIEIRARERRRRDRHQADVGAAHQRPEGGPREPGKFSSNGKLSVDTLSK
jgi:carboxyl-terminal processing protease